MAAPSHRAVGHEVLDTSTRVRLSLSAARENLDDAKAEMLRRGEGKHPYDDASCRLVRGLYGAILTASKHEPRGLPPVRHRTRRPG